MVSLAGKTLFVTGASRGIGLAIAVRCARDGANVVIAAKTATPHPKLAGTIYTAAKEIEEAGGQALPLVVDIRSEQEVEKAVEQAVDRFGGIDILINNASAIWPMGTLQTSMKKWDLMHSVNARGTFLCSQKCLPHLIKSAEAGRNPHILNISPPLSMLPQWFSPHCAYTMAKYGMSMCVLGMAEEFKDDGVAVNALWPRTAIATAAVDWLGGDAAMRASRKVDIMSDAAHLILTRPSRKCTGQFLVDDKVLHEWGNVSFEELKKYAVDPSVDLAADFFLEDSEEWLQKVGSGHGTLRSKL